MVSKLYSIGATSKKAQLPVVPIETILNETFGGDLSKYSVVNGTGTISIVAGKLRINATLGDFSTYISLNDSLNPFNLHMLEKWTQTITFITPTLGVGTYGFGSGIRSTMSSPMTASDNIVRIALDDLSPTGSHYYYSSQNHAAPNQDVQGSNALASSTTFIMVLDKNKNVYTTTIKTAGGSTIYSTSKTYNITTSTGVWIHNCGKFSLWAFGGVFDIISWNITSIAQKNVDVVAVGDSNMLGFYTGTNARRYVEQACLAKGYTCEVLAGIDQGTGDIASYAKAVIALNPRIVYTNAYSNSIANGIASGIYHASQDAFVAEVKAGLPGVIIIHGIPIARGVNYTTLVTNRTQSTYPGERICNLYLDTKQAGNDNLQGSMNSGDNVHGNGICNDTCAATLLAQLP